MSKLRLHLWLSKRQLAGDVEEVGDSNHNVTHTTTEGWEVTNVADENGIEEAPLVQEVSGIVDECEDVKALVERMTIEDQNYEALLEDEGSDDEHGEEQQTVSLEHILIR